MGRRSRSLITKQNAGRLLGAVAMGAVLYMAFGPDKKKAGPHARPMVGRGYGSSPYGFPKGNPGLLRSLNLSKGCACHSGDIHV